MEDSYVVTHYMAGQQNYPSPFENAASVDSMSHNWRGPGFYSTEEKRFILLKDTTEEGSRSGSASYARSPTHVPTGTLPAYSDDAWTRRWRGPGASFYSPKEHIWSSERPGAAVTSDARLFMNEEDWLKYKYMCANPMIANAKVISGGKPEEADPNGRAEPRKKREWERNILSDYF